MNRNLMRHFRVSGTEWLEEVAPNEPSWRPEDTAKLALVLAEHGVDLLDVSAGGNSANQRIRHGPEYQVPFAATVKQAVGSKMFVGSVGGLGDGVVAAGVVESGRADDLAGAPEVVRDNLVEVHAIRRGPWRGAAGCGGARRFRHPVTLSRASDDGTCQGPCEDYGLV